MQSQQRLDYSLGRVSAFVRTTTPRPPAHNGAFSLATQSIAYLRAFCTSTSSGDTCAWTWVHGPDGDARRADAPQAEVPPRRRRRRAWPSANARLQRRLHLVGHQWCKWCSGRAVYLGKSAAVLVIERIGTSRSHRSRQARCGLAVAPLASNMRPRVSRTGRLLYVFIPAMWLRSGRKECVVKDHPLACQSTAKVGSSTSSSWK